jgi:methylphosphotriester-DNA--protein-cysteine methyltransferase
MNVDELEIQKDIVFTIQIVMKAHDISENELAKGCGITVYGLHQIFECKRKITFLMMAKMQKALRIRFEVNAISNNTNP